MFRSGVHANYQFFENQAEGIRSTADEMILNETVVQEKCAMRDFERIEKNFYGRVFRKWMRIVPERNSSFQMRRMRNSIQISECISDIADWRNIYGMWTFSMGNRILSPRLLTNHRTDARNLVQIKRDSLLIILKYEIFIKRIIQCLDIYLLYVHCKTQTTYYV